MFYSKDIRNSISRQAIIIIGKWERIKDLADKDGPRETIYKEIYNIRKATKRVGDDIIQDYLNEWENRGNEKDEINRYFGRKMKGILRMKN